MMEDEILACTDLWEKLTYTFFTRQLDSMLPFWF